MTEEQEEAHAIRPLMNITLPCDRRIVHGASAVASPRPASRDVHTGQEERDYAENHAILVVR